MKGGGGGGGGEMHTTGVGLSRTGLLNGIWGLGGGTTNDAMLSLSGVLALVIWITIPLMTLLCIMSIWLRLRREAGTVGFFHPYA